MADPVITVRRTIQDGQVVAWHRDLLAATNNSPVLSASRRGVMVHGAYLNTIPPAWIEAANEAHDRLSRDRDADLTRLATHRAKGLFGPLELQPPGEESNDG